MAERRDKDKLWKDKRTNIAVKSRRGERTVRDKVDKKKKLLEG